MKISLENNITLITESDIGGLLKNEVPYYVVSKIDDDRYAIKPLPLVMKEKRTEMDGEIAYDYSKLNKHNQKRYESLARTFLKGEDGFYYQNVRKYTCKRKIKNVTN